MQAVKLTRGDHSGDDLNSIGRRAADIVHTTRQRSDLPELNLGLQACQGAALPAERSACLSAPQPDGSTCYLLLSLHDRCCMHLMPHASSRQNLQQNNRAVQAGARGAPWATPQCTHRIQGGCSHPSTQLELCIPHKGHGPCRLEPAEQGPHFGCNQTWLVSVPPADT